MSTKKVKVKKNRDLKKMMENPSEGIIMKYKPPNIIDLTKNKEMCENITRSSCWRPDIFLDKGCLECTIHHYCICPIKKLIKREEPLRGKKRKK